MLFLVDPWTAKDEYLMLQSPVGLQQFHCFSFHLEFEWNPVSADSATKQAEQLQFVTKSMSSMFSFWSVKQARPVPTFESNSVR